MNQPESSTPLPQASVTAALQLYSDGTTKNNTQAMLELLAVLRHATDDQISLAARSVKAKRPMGQPEANPNPGKFSARGALGTTEENWENEGGAVPDPTAPAPSPQRQGRAA